jgi:hypothetical protein
MEAINQSYKRHAQHEVFMQLASCDTSPESIDAWCHERMIKTVLPLLESYPMQGY